MISTLSTPTSFELNEVFSGRKIYNDKLNVQKIAIRGNIAFFIRLL